MWSKDNQKTSCAVYAVQRLQLIETIHTAVSPYTDVFRRKNDTLVKVWQSKKEVSLISSFNPVIMLMVSRDQKIIKSNASTWKE